MSFVPHTSQDRKEMLATLGLSSSDEVFQGIPPKLQAPALDSSKVPGPLSEPEIVRYMRSLADRNTRGRLVCFAGGGVYDEFIPAAVAELAGRPEFKTSYTPYQAEVSQGVLQALFEYQSLVARLTGMDVANASVYDGGSAVVEAANMAVAITGKPELVVSRGVNPRYREMLATFASGSGHSVYEADLDQCATKIFGDKSVSEMAGQTGPAAVIIQHPNYLGVIEDLELLVDIAHSAGALAIVVSDPVANGVLRRPGEYGADIVVAEGQPLGNPLMFGGPYLGILACKEAYVRYLPGRIAGMTKDADGRTSFALALQGREQHIRRSKASSNICTNQTLNAITACIYLCWLGPEGLARSARIACLLAHKLASSLAQIDGFEIATDLPYFREFPLRIPVDTPTFLEGMAREGILAGIPLESHYPELGNTILIAATSARTIDEVERFVRAATGVGK